MKGWKRLRGKNPRAWTLVFDGPPVNGKRKQQWIAFSGTAREADAKLRQLIGEVEGGRYVNAGRLTVGQYLDQWLAALKARVMVDDIERDISPATWTRYKAIVEFNLKPTIGMIRLRDLSALDLEAALARWRTMPRSDHQKGTLSQRSVHHIYTTLRNALNRAVKWKLIAVNPCAGVDAPVKGRKSLSPLSIPEFKAVLLALHRGEVFAPAFVSAMTGLRRGEILGLQRRDVDWDQHSIMVERSLSVMLDGRPNTLKDTKTRKRRSVPLNTPAEFVLREHLARLGPAAATSPVFPDPKLGPDALWTLDCYGVAFRVAVRPLGIAASPHRLRHCFASLAQHEGAALKVVAEILGHASTSDMTDRIYTHPFDDQKRQAVEALGVFAAALLPAGFVSKPLAKDDAEAK